MSDQPLRPLRPAEIAPKEEDNATPKPFVLPPKKRVNSNACDRCRAKRTRCDGKRPICSACIERDSECSYRRRPPRSELQSFVDIVYHLKDASETECSVAVQKLRSGLSPRNVLSHSSIGDPIVGSHTPSKPAAIETPPPPPKGSLASELNRLHPVLYPLIALNELISETDSIFKPVLPLLEDPVASKAHGEDCSMLPPSTLNHFDLSLPTGNSSALNASVNFNGSLPSASFCDERLRQLRINYWTAVRVSDLLAAQMLSHYFAQSHAIIGLFDADLFIDNLVYRRQEFCTPFLLSAVLAYASQSYAGVDTQAGSLTQAFFDEATKLWRAERNNDHINNVAAMFMLSVSSHTYVSEVPASRLLEEGRRMAERMKLFGVRHTPAVAAMFKQMPLLWQRAASHVAYGSYVWLTLNAFYCSIEPIEFPPILPIPGGISTSTTASKSPLDWLSHPLPDFMGRTFTYLCQFWTIMQEVVAVYFDHRKRSYGTQEDSPDPSLAFSEAKFEKLLLWSDTLDPAVHRGPYASNHAYIFHILLHSAIIDIFLPLAEQSGSQRLAMGSGAYCVNDVLLASTEQLKHLVQECRVSRPATFSVTYTNAAMTHICNILCSNTGKLNANADEWLKKRQDVRLCLASCSDMAVCFPVFGSVTRGNLTMALRAGLLDIDEAKHRFQDLRARTEHHRALTAQPAGDFTLDFSAAASTEPDNAKAMAVARQFDEITFFSDFTMLYDDAGASTMG